MRLPTMFWLLERRERRRLADDGPEQLAGGMSERLADDMFGRLADERRLLFGQRWQAGEQQRLVPSRSSVRCMSMEQEQHGHIVAVRAHIVAVPGHRWCVMVQHKRSSGPGILGSTRERRTCGLTSMVCQLTLNGRQLAASCRMISTHFVVR